MGGTGAGRGPRGAPGWGVDDEGLVDGLAAGIVGVQRPADWLFGTEDPLLALLARDEAQDEVGRVEVPAEGVGVLAQDKVADIVDEVVLVDGDEGC
jgi:hypothetical protein